MASLAQTIRDFWFAMTGQDRPANRLRPRSSFTIPARERPHDLDDPFFDPEVQSRMAGVIADNAKEAQRH